MLTFEQLMVSYNSQALRTHKADELDLAVYALGLAGEYWELVGEILTAEKPRDMAKLGKEAGDVLWYLCASLHSLGYSDAFTNWTPNVEPTYLEAHLKELGMCSGQYCDLIKKAVGHGHSLDRCAAAKGTLLTALNHLYCIINLSGLTLGLVMAANIAKLRARYPEGFSHEASINRAD